jgi:peptide/nickel transport system substrate-binding protein
MSMPARCCLSVILLLAMGCSQAQPLPGGNSAPVVERSVPTPKTITVGILQEPIGFGPFGGSTSGGGSHQLDEVVSRYLVGLDNQSQPYPEIAIELPSVDNGTWVINADKTMETTYRLRKDVFWHDGTPMVADDWLFGWEVDKDPQLPRATVVPVRYIDAMTAPDDYTLVMHWSETYPFANSLMRGHLNPLSRAKYQELYRADKERFANSPIWSFEYVGVGPYRIGEWIQGTQIRFEAFDRYFAGRPKIDVVNVRFLHDPNTLMANILSDSIDVYLPLGLEKDNALELQRTWAAPGTGNQLLIYPDGRLRFIEMQMRADYQRPRASGDRRVREAIYRAMDRRELVDNVIAGLGQTADSWVLPADSARNTVLRGAIPDYSLDPQAAQRLLDEAGWRRGSDGILVHQSTGERFETAIWNVVGGGHDRENSIIADRLRPLGIVMEQVMVPTSLMDDSQHRASFPGPAISSLTANLNFENGRLRNRPPRPTEPLGSPRNGYENPQVNTLVDRLQVSVGADERLQLQRQILEIALYELPMLPLYWDIETLTARKGITGLAGRTGRHVLFPLATWNIAQWDRS